MEFSQKEGSERDSQKSPLLVDLLSMDAMIKSRISRGSPPDVVSAYVERRSAKILGEYIRQHVSANAPVAAIPSENSDEFYIGNGEINGTVKGVVYSYFPEFQDHLEHPNTDDKYVTLIVESNSVSGIDDPHVESINDLLRGIPDTSGLDRTRIPILIPVVSGLSLTHN